MAKREQKEPEPLAPPGKARKSKAKAVRIENVDCLPALDDYCAALGKSQREMAPYFGITQSGINRMLKPRNGPRDMRVLESSKGHLMAIEVRVVAQGSLSVRAKRSRARKDGLAPV